MKYFWFIIFNLVGIYILIMLLVGKNGIIENFKKAEKLAELKKEKIKLEIQIEELKNNIETLRKLKDDENYVILEQGRKKDNTVIFKFIDKKTEKPEIEKTFDENLSLTLYIIFGIIIIIILSGNLAIFLTYNRIRL